MGNRAVITICTALEPKNSSELGVYLHWNGGRHSVSAFLAYCAIKQYRPPETDCYGWARLCQVVGNYFGGALSLGIDSCKRLDCDNYDNGVYVIKNWRIVDRKYEPRYDTDDYNVREMISEINKAQPVAEQLTEAEIDNRYAVYLSQNSQMDIA